LLIFTTLIANISWAVDMHAEAHASDWPGNIAICASDWPQDSEHSDTDAPDACDHCCHGFAHIVGFVAQPRLAVTLALDVALASHGDDYHSRLPLPPTPPPVI